MKLVQALIGRRVNVSVVSGHCALNATLAAADEQGLLIEDDSGQFGFFPWRNVTSVATVSNQGFHAARETTGEKP